MPPAPVSTGNLVGSCDSGPTDPSWALDSRHHWGLLGPRTPLLTETKILRNLTSWVPSQMKRRGPLLLFGTDTQAAAPTFQSVGGGMSSMLE